MPIHRLVGLILAPILIVPVAIISYQQGGRGSKKSKTYSLVRLRSNSLQIPRREIQIHCLVLIFTRVGYLFMRVGCLQVRSSTLRQLSKAYGILAFPSRATTKDSLARHRMIFNAYVAGLPSVTELAAAPAYAPPKSQMVTVWPIETSSDADRLNATRRDKVC